MNYLRILFSICIVFLGSTAIGQEISQKEATFLRSVRALRKKDPKAAKASLAKRVQETPSNVHLFELGLWQAEDGDDTNAIATYKKLIAKTPNYPGAMRNLGIMSLRKAKYAEAVKILSMLSRREDLGAELQRSMGSAFSILGNHTAALAAYRRAVIGFPDDDQLQLRISQTLFQLKSLGEAEAIARGILRRDPKSIGAWLIIGNCNASKKQYGKAVDALEAARRLTQKPNNELMIALGDLYVTMELPKTAWKCYSAVPKAASKRLAALGRQFVHDGDIESAMAIAETLKKSPKHTGEADLLTGLCELSQKRYPQAEAALRLALKTDPGNGETLASLGDVASRQKKITKAISWYRSARSSASWKRYAMEAELDLHLQNKDYAKARQLLTELTHDFPSPHWDQLRKELSSH